jgi:hypothetical protein
MALSALSGFGRTRRVAGGMASLVSLRLRAMAFKVKVTVRDGRTGREGGEAGVSLSGKGAILQTFEKDFPPFGVGDKLTLPDGTTVVVIGTEQQIGGQFWGQTVYIGNLPADLGERQAG